MKTCKINITSFLSTQDKYKLWSFSFDQQRIYNEVLKYTKNNSFDYKIMHQIGKNIRNELNMSSPAKMSQNTVIRFINNCKSYLALKRTDDTARAPTKFASNFNFQPLIIDYNSSSGFKIKDTKLEIKVNYKSYLTIQLPRYALQKLEEVDYSVAQIVFSMQDNDFYLSFILKDINPTLDLNQDNWMSIDPGLTSIISLITNDGTAIKYENNQYKNIERQISAIQSKLDKKKKYSNRYNRLKIKFKSLSKKRSNKNKNFQHKLTKEIINLCTEKNIGRIFYGDIKVKKLTKSKVASKGMNKSTQNRGSLGRTKQFLQYKAGNNGVAFELVNEAWTSKTNCLTGEIWPNMTLGVREVELAEGLVIDRDINAAINIAQRALGSWLPQLLWLKEITTTEKYVVI